MQRGIEALNGTLIWILTLMICCVIHVISMSDLVCQCLPALPMEGGGVPCPEGIECGPRTTRCLCNEAGLVVFEESDSNGDENVDTQTHFAYCAEGHLLEREIDRGLDGNVDERHTWVHVDGNLQAYEVDRDGDGIVDSRTSYFTAPDGVVFWEDSDVDGDGIAEERTTFVYDGDNRVGRVVDVGVDGTIEQECEYDPPCPPPHSWESCIGTLYCYDVPPPAPTIIPRLGTTAIERDQEEPDDRVYDATLDELLDPSSELRSSTHTLVLFSVDEEAAGWMCEPCEVMQSYFGWRARDTRRLGVSTSHIRYVVLEIDPDEIETVPNFLASQIEGWPTIVHLMSTQETELVEDRLRGLNIGGLRSLVRRLEGEFWR